MMTRTKLALTALILLSVASAAQAGGKDDADVAGGYAIGPLGQSFVDGNAGEAFRYVPRSDSTIGTEGRCWEMGVNGHYDWAACR